MSQQLLPQQQQSQQPQQQQPQQQQPSPRISLQKKFQILFRNNQHRRLNYAILMFGILCFVVVIFSGSSTRYDIRSSNVRRGGSDGAYLTNTHYLNKRASSSSQMMDSMASPESASGGSAGRLERDSDTEDEEVIHEQSEGGVGEGNQGGEGDVQPTKIIVKSGSMSVVVTSKSMTEADRSDANKAFANKIEELVKAKGGYIQSRYGSMYRIGMGVRIPVDSFDAFIDDIGTLCSTVSKTLADSFIESAQVSSLNTETVDETMKYVDWKVREKSLRASHQRLLELLNKAEGVKDILEIEREISRITQHLESIEAQSKVLAKDAKMSRLQLTIEAGYKSPDTPTSDHFLTRFIRTIYEAIAGLFTFIENLVVVAIYIIVYAVPFIILATCIALCTQ